MKGYNLVDRGITEEGKEDFEGFLSSYGYDLGHKWRKAYPGLGRTGTYELWVSDSEDKLYFNKLYQNFLEKR